MIGLLIKDIYNLRKQLIWYLCMTILFFALSLALKNLAFCAALSALIAVSVPVSAIAYEEKENWQKFIAASGTDIKIIVLEKYLLGMIFALGCATVYLVAFLIGSGAGLKWSEYAIPVAMSAVVLSVVLPLVFKYGVEKGKVTVIVIVAALMVVWVGILTLLDRFAVNSDALVIGLSVAMAIISLIVSFAVSIKIYKRKEF